MRSLDDAAIIAAAGRGDRAAAGELLRRFDPLVQASARSFCRAWRRWRPDPDDVRQEARLILLRVAAAHDPERETFERHARAVLATNLLDCLRTTSALRRSREVYARHAARWRAGEEVPGWARETLSLDAAPEDGRALLEDQAAPGLSPEARAEQRELVTMACEAIDLLPARRAHVLRQRYLVADEVLHQDLAPAFGVTPARISQIERESLDLIRKRLDRRPGA